MRINRLFLGIPLSVGFLFGVQAQNATHSVRDDVGRNATSKLEVVYFKTSKSNVAASVKRALRGSDCYCNCRGCNNTCYVTCHACPGSECDTCGDNCCGRISAATYA